MQFDLFRNTDLDVCLASIEQTKEEMNNQRWKLAVLDVQLSTLKNQLKELCTEHKWEIKRDYTPGDYFNKSVSEKWCECTVCGAKTEVLRKEGTHE